MNKKAFTLIELLAVIVVLSLILVIVVPSVSDVITVSKKSSFLTSAKAILRQVEYDNFGISLTERISLEDLELTDISRDDYDLENSYVYKLNQKLYINLIGKGKYEGIVFCEVSSDTKINDIKEGPCS